MAPLLITIAAAVLALVVGYFVLRRLRRHGFLVCGAAMVGIVFLFLAALLYILPLAGYTPPVPVWSMKALLFSLLGLALLIVLAFFIRWIRHELPLEKKENLAYHDDTDFPERL